MHPYRLNERLADVNDDADVRAFARQSRRAKALTRATVLIVAGVLVFAIVDWPATANVVSGCALRKIF